MKLFPLYLMFILAIGCTPEKETTRVSEKKDSIQTSPANDVVSEKYYGIDISQYNGDVLNEIPQKDSLTFIICKATEGVTLVDPDFNANWQWMGEKGFVRGAYHFYHFSDDPIQQARFFLSVFQDWNQSDLPLIIDVEEASIPRGSTPDPAKMLNDLRSFLSFLEKETGRVPIFYTDYTFANSYLTDPFYASYPLWLAEYSGASSPKIPEAWKEKGFFIWQKSDSYSILSNQLDFDLYIGKKSDLLR